MRAMILAAGLGTRLRPITYAMPKPMVPVVNRPVMEHIVRLAARHGFDELVANLHWFPDLIRDHFGDGSEYGVSITWSPEEKLLGTSGGVRGAAEFLGDSFLVISGDALTDIDLSAMREFHESHDGIATLATKRVADTSEFGVSITDDEGRIQGFQEKPEPAEALSDLANCGIYMFRSEVFEYFPAPGESKAAGDDDPDGFADWAMDVFPSLLDSDVPFYSHEIEAYWNDIGNLDELHAGNLDALRGDVELDRGVPERSDGVWSGSDPLGADITAPALIGAGVTLGGDVHLDGDVVLGDGCVVGAGSRLKSTVVLPGVELPERTVLAGGVAARAEAEAPS